MFNKRRRRAATSRSITGHVVLQVAAILIAIGVIMKMYQMSSQRADDSAFRRIREEIDTLDLPASGKETLRNVTTLAGDLTSDARSTVSAD